MTGVVLLLVVIGFGFTGYLLPWDQKSYWATTVGHALLAWPRLLGNWILRMMRGGDDLSAVTLARFFGAHVWVLPADPFTPRWNPSFLVIRNGISEIPKNEGGKQ